MLNHRVKAAFCVVYATIWPGISMAQETLKAPEDLIGAWIVTVEGGGRSRSLLVSAVSKRSDAGFDLEAKFGWEGAENPVSSAQVLPGDKGLHLSLASKSGAKVFAEQHRDGSFVGTFVNTSGSSVPMKIARATGANPNPIIVPPPSSVAAPATVEATRALADVPVACVSTVDPCIQKPGLKIGERWVFKKIDLYNGQEIERFEQKITGLSNDDVRWEITRLSSASGTEVGKTYRRFSDRATGSFSNSNIMEGKVIEFSFPLETGKKWKHAAKWKRQSGPGTIATEIKAEVLGWEDIEVPAGKFKALKIGHYNNYVGNDNGKSWSGSAVKLLWYVPGIKHFVKEEFVDRGSYAEKTVLELVEYETK